MKSDNGRLPVRYAELIQPRGSLMGLTRRNPPKAAARAGWRLITMRQPSIMRRRRITTAKRPCSTRPASTSTAGSTLQQPWSTVNAPTSTVRPRTVDRTAGSRSTKAAGSPAWTRRRKRAVDNPTSHRPNPAPDPADKVPEMSERITEIDDQSRSGRRCEAACASRCNFPLMEDMSCKDQANQRVRSATARSVGLFSGSSVCLFRFFSSCF